VDAGRLQRAGIYDGAEDAGNRDTFWRWERKGSDVSRISDSNGAAIGGDWRGPWANRQPCARAGDCDAALGSVGVRPVDTDVRSAVCWSLPGLLACWLPAANARANVDPLVGAAV